jgi:hypothetical protein
MASTDVDTRHAPALPIRLAISWLTNAVVLGVVAAVLCGVHVKDAGALLLAAAVFGVLNTIPWQITGGRRKLRRG